MYNFTLKQNLVNMIQVVSEYVPTYVQKIQQRYMGSKTGVNVNNILIPKKGFNNNLKQ